MTCFQSRGEAVKFLESLKLRLAKLGLELYPDKTKLIELGRFAAANRRRRGLGKPETFDFLGFTHSCSVTRASGKFKLLRKTTSKRMNANLRKLYVELRKRINWSIDRVGAWLRRSVKGYYNYYAVPDNLSTLGRFRHIISKLWMKVVKRKESENQSELE